ncbi:hypothetical protein PHAVU_009G065900, partial [Phaseolus vulgaris]
SNTRVKNIGFYISWQKNKCSIYVGEALHQSAIYPSKAEAVGITSYMVQLKEGITLTAQKNRDIGGVLK